MNAKAKKPTLADAFAALWAEFVPELPPVREFCFHPTRKWRFDFAWPAARVAVEMEGGIWIGGGHTRGLIYAGNCEKYNAAAVLGWRLLRYVTNDLRKRPVQMLEEVKALVTGVA